jgi:putative transcriptional regulator
VPSTKQIVADDAELAKTQTRKKAPEIYRMHISPTFAARFQIPIGTLRDWEQGRVAPDQAPRAYRAVIARDPEAARKALMPRA